MSRVSQTLDRIHTTFNDDNLVANAGLLLPTTLVNQLDLEALINTARGSELSDRPLLRARGA